jgi:hypothetical protein
MYHHTPFFTLLELRKLSLPYLGLQVAAIIFIFFKQYQLIFFILHHLEILLK